MDLRFQTTQWSQVLRAQERNTLGGRKALNEFCSTYWQPTYVFVRSRGHKREAAQDLTQDFFAWIVVRDFLEQADPDRGRLRSFLLASLKNFLSHAREKDAAVKRGGRAVLLALEDCEQALGAELSKELTPERLFHRRWATTLLERAMSRLEEEMRQRRRGDVFEHLKGYLSGYDSMSYERLSHQLGMSTGSVKTTIHRLRRRFGKLLRNEVAATVINPLDVEDELRDVLSALETS